MRDDNYSSEDYEENVYSGEVREDLIDGDEISPEEEGFMAGYDEAEESDDEKEEKESEDEEETEE